MKHNLILTEMDGLSDKIVGRVIASKWLPLDEVIELLGYTVDNESGYLVNSDGEVTDFYYDYLIVDSDEEDFEAYTDLAYTDLEG